MKRNWREPINGTSCFFSEETFTRVLGTVSLHDTLSRQFESYGSSKVSRPVSNKADSGDKQTLSTTPGTCTQPLTNTNKDKQNQLAKLDKTEHKSTPHSQAAGPKFEKATARKSGLSCEEQRRYLELFQKYLLTYHPQQPGPAEIKELSDFESLQLRVSAEQIQYLKYLEQVANSRRFDYNHLLPSARKYVNEKLNYSWQRVDQYARYYVKDKTVPIAVTTGADYSPCLEHVQLLLQLGTVPKLFLPDMSRGQTVIPTTYEKIHKRFPSTGQKLKDPASWNHQGCSKDPNAEPLAERHDCQLVLCTSVLKCLVDNHAPNYESAWEIPIVVKLYEHDYEEITSKQKVVYIDKPFTSKSMSPREKNTLYHKYALKTFITQVAQAKGAKPANKTESIATTNRPRSTNPFDNITMDNIETFGSFEFGPSTRTQKSDIKSPSDKRLAGVNSCDQDLVDKLKANSKQERIDIIGLHVRDVPQQRVCSDSSKDSILRFDPVVASVEANSNANVFCCVSGGETSQGEGLVIDIPVSPTTQFRRTRSQHRSNSASQRLPAHSCSSDDDRQLMIDTCDSDGHDLRLFDKSKEFQTPKRVLRKRKGTESKTCSGSDSDISPERRSLRSQSSRGACGLNSYEHSDSKKLCNDVLDSRVSPSKVDNIMIKTSSEDLSSLPHLAKGADRCNRGREYIGVSPLDSILKMQQQMMPTTMERTGHTENRAENPSDFCQPEEHNVSYNLWNFSGLSLLIRTSCHGAKRDITQNKPACIVAKMEYQAKFGVEQLTTSEVSRNWISCYVKPNTKLIRGRINALTSELIKIEEVDPTSIVNSALSFVPQQSQASLHNLFLSLTELVPGQYLLSHSKGDNFYQLHSSTNVKRGAYDLRFSYMGFGSNDVPVSDSHVPWIPIDPTIILPCHRKNGRIPCTFEPLDFVAQTQRKFNSYRKKNKKKRCQKRKNQGK